MSNQTAEIKIALEKFRKGDELSDADLRLLEVWSIELCNLLLAGGKEFHIMYKEACRIYMAVDGFIESRKNL